MIDRIASAAGQPQLVSRIRVKSQRFAYDAHRLPISGPSAPFGVAKIYDIRARARVVPLREQAVLLNFLCASRRQIIHKQYPTGGFVVREIVETLLIAQDQPRIEHFVRQPANRWLFSASESLHDVVEIASIECELPLTDVYDKVDMAGDA